jgi:hypothetical protein
LGIAGALLLADTAAPASSIPAPQVSIVHKHSNWSIAVPVLSNCGAVHCGTPAPLSLLVVGNGRAAASSVNLSWNGVSAGCAENINATVPDTSGAEKLVPSDGLRLSV